VSRSGRSNRGSNDYLLRAPVRLDTISWTPGGPVHIRTPPVESLQVERPHPRTGQTSITLDPLDWIHAVTTHIPDPRQHAVRYYGAYSNRSRGHRKRLPGRWRPRAAPACRQPSEPATPPPTRQASPHSQARKASWARLLRKLLEIDPLLCPRCRVELRVVSVITEPAIVDRPSRASPSAVSRSGRSNRGSNDILSHIAGRLCPPKPLAKAGLPSTPSALALLLPALPALSLSKGACRRAA